MFQIKKDSHFTVFCCITETDLRINAISSIFSFSNQPGGFFGLSGPFLFCLDLVFGCPLGVAPLLRLQCTASDLWKEAKHCMKSTAGVFITL